MRFSYAESMVDPSLYAPLARAAEAAGFDSFVVPESVIYPRDSQTRYPYVENGSRDFLEDRPFIDPFSLIPALGAETTTLRFVTYVLKLPLRSPVLVAKQASSVAVLTANRLGLGVGLSPWPEDYAACGQAWQRRGARMDEQIDIVQGLCAGGFFEYHGEFYDLEPIKICPCPTEHLPILVGGHSQAALERAARCDGWLGPPLSFAALSETLPQLLRLRNRLDRAGEPFEIHAATLDAYSPGGCRRLEELGVTDVIVGFRNPYTSEPDTQSLEDKIAAIERFADSVIAYVRA